MSCFRFIDQLGTECTGVQERIASNEYVSYTFHRLSRSTCFYFRGIDQVHTLKSSMPKKCKCPSSSQIGALEVLVGVYNTHSRLLSSKAPPPPPLSSSSSKLVKLPSLVQTSKPSMTAVEGNNDTSTTTTSLILSTFLFCLGFLCLLLKIGLSYFL